MRAVVLATDPDDGNARRWCSELEQRGIRARFLSEDPAVLPSADFAVAHLLLHADRARHPAWTAAERYERARIPLLNSTATLALCGDKISTFRAWRAADLPQPRTWALTELRDWPDGLMLLKPALGQSAREISVVHDRAAADAIASRWTDSALVQEALACRSVLRVHATQQRVLGAFARPAAAIAGLPTPDPTERRFPIGRQLAALAKAAVRALGAGMLGLDIIEHDGRFSLLEANPTFSSPTHLPELLRELTDEAVALCMPSTLNPTTVGTEHHPNAHVVLTESRATLVIQIPSSRGAAVIVRFDRIGVEFPPLSTPDPDGASVVQELLGGKFGEMSTFMNYTFQSFNFRARQSARPFFDLVSNIAAEEFGHMEVVATAINMMMTGASPVGEADPTAFPLSGLKSMRNAQQYVVGGHGALPSDSMGNPWTGLNVFSSGDLIEDLTHNYFLETGARSQKLRVYETVDHPTARALTGYLLIRGGVHQVAYARALENLTGANMSKLFPSPRVPTDKIPECQPYIKAGEHTKLYRFSPTDYHELAAVWNGNHPETGDPLVVVDTPPHGFIPQDLPAQPAGWAPDYAPEEIAEIAKKLRQAAGLSDEPTGEVITPPQGAFGKLADKLPKP